MPKPTLVESPITAEALARLKIDGPCELVDGRIVPVSPAGRRHTVVVGRIIALLTKHVEKRDLGLVTSGEVGYLVRRRPDSVRAPDVAVLSHDTLARAEAEGGTFFGRAPDLAVEVLSPDDSWEAVERKVRDYLHAGSKAVWVVSLAAEEVFVYAPGGGRRALGRRDRIEGGDALPGFRSTVAAFFDEPPRKARR